MGNLFGGGSSPKEREPTAQERELAAQGVEKYNRYIRQYAPLEEASISNINRSTENLQAGRTNADLMQEATTTATQSIESGGVAQGLSSLDSLSRGLARANSTNAVAALASDRAAKDDRALTNIETGLGIASNQQQGLTQLAYTKNQEAINDLQREIAIEDSEAQMQASILGSLAGSGANMYQRKQEQDYVNSLYRAPALNDFSDY